MSRFDEIVDVAERVLEEEGPSALTMRRLADELGIQAPSLYKHVACKSDILVALQQRALEDMGTAVREAGGDLAAFARAYRQWALAHPRLYEVAVRRPLPRERLAPGVEDDAAAPLLALVGGDRATARALWGLAHGLVDLEISGRFPPGADVDAAWARAVQAFGGAGRPRRQ